MIISARRRVTLPASIRLKVYPADEPDREPTRGQGILDGRRLFYPRLNAPDEYLDGWEQGLRLARSS